MATDVEPIEFLRDTLAHLPRPKTGRENPKKKSSR